MLRRLLLPLALLAVALAAATSGSARSTVTPKLTGEVGPGYTIELKSAAGKDVKSLKAGTYTIVVQDKASDHNFHLIGPGVNKTTSVSAKVTVTWKVTLKKGTYKYVCDPHKAFMKGSFTVK